MEHPVKVLVVTTFNLDEYVCEALRAGAGGFPLKDAPSAQLLHSARTVVIGGHRCDTAGPAGGAPSRGRIPRPVRPAEDTAHDISPARREGEVLRLVADGLSRTEITAALLMGQETVKTFVPRILAEPGFATVFRPSPTPTVEGWWPEAPLRGTGDEVADRWGAVAKEGRGGHFLPRAKPPHREGRDHPARTGVPPKR